MTQEKKQKRIRRYKIYHSGSPHIRIRGVRHYFKDIDRNGYSLVCVTNTGYFGGFRVLGIEYGIDDKAIVELL